MEEFDSVGMHQGWYATTQSVGRAGRAVGRAGRATGHVVIMTMLKTVVGTLVVAVTVAYARVKAVWVAIPMIGVVVLLLVSKCMIKNNERYLRGDGCPDSNSRSRSDAILSECEVRAEETGTFGELVLGGGNRNALAVKLQGRASRKLATSDNVRIFPDGANAVLHVASTRLANNPGHINAASGSVTGLETLFVCVGIDETVRDCTLY
jgi:hypothetical protein